LELLRGEILGGWPTKFWRQDLDLELGPPTVLVEPRLSSDAGCAFASGRFVWNAQLQGKTTFGYFSPKQICNYTMASTPSHDIRKVSINRARPPPTALPSPHTPLSRSISGLYGSPSTASFRTDEENTLIFEFGSRFFRAGFAGDHSPRCVIGYSPELQRRVGDYRQWALGYETQRRKRKRGSDWGQEYELWRSHVEDVDRGLMADKVERLVREVEHNYLMLDNRQKKIALVLSSAVPRPLLSALLSSLFNTLQASTITLLPSAVMAAASAGVRSALVMDIGWEETTITAVCEYREVLQRRSVRAGKLLSEEYWKLLCAGNKKALREQGLDDSDPEVSFEETEEIMSRMGWCRSRSESLDPPSAASEAVAIPLPQSEPHITLSIPFTRLSDPVESVVFANDSKPDLIDDHDLPLHMLLFRSLLQLPIDIRKLCMSRIIFTGGVSNIPGLKSRLLQELTAHVAEHGWDPVKNYGSATEGRRLRKEAASQRKSDYFPNVSLPILQKESHTTYYPPDPDADPNSRLPAGLRTSEPDETMAKVQSRATSHLPAHQQKPPIEGAIRAVNTLGSWAGASLVTNLRIRGTVEIDRERFLQHGLTGAGGAATAAIGKKDAGTSSGTTTTRQSLAGPGTRAAPAAAAGDRNSWTLGVWA
jgi:actin-related protein